MKKSFVIILFLSVVFSSKAQKDISTILRYSDTTSFNFTNEWQYLSTDIYLFNAPEFSKLINELNVGLYGKKRKRRKSKVEEEWLEYLFISAKLKNVSFFGNKDITYPLYNFQVETGGKDKNRKYVNHQIDHIRIIDNLPLYTARDYIDAEISVKALTDNSSNIILGLIARQLQNIAGISNPSKAILSIVGEFGHFMENSSQKKEYQFSSSIRLFEQNNFDTRLHSLKIYELNTDNSSPDKINTKPLATFFRDNDNPQINRDKLDSIINYKSYPILVVANYKSLYKMEEVSGDEITFASIEKRKLKIESDFRSGLINTETYRQETDFISFITQFAHLKSNLEMYNLNYKTGNSDAVFMTLFNVLKYYRQVNELFKQMEFKYKSNSTYKTVFRAEYKSIIGFANIYLESDHNLKSGKEMINTLAMLESNKLDKADSVTVENNLRNLHFIDAFDKSIVQKSVAGESINKYVEVLEQQYYNKHFKIDVDKLDATIAHPRNNSYRDKIQHKIVVTNCLSCRENGKKAIEKYNNKLSEYHKIVMLKNVDSLTVSIENKMFDIWDKRDLLRENFGNLPADSLLSESTKLLKKKYLQVIRDVDDLSALLKINVSEKENVIIAEYIVKLETLPTDIMQNIDFICTKMPEMCRKQVVVKKDTVNLIDTLLVNKNVDSLLVNKNIDSLQIVNFETLIVK